MTRELVLLSPYRYPAQYAMTMSDEDMAAWINGFTALWHPAALWQATSAPRFDTTYDHETPKPNCLYALPESPPSYLPEDWEQRVRAAGSLVFKATPDRAATLAHLKAALTAEPAACAKECLDLPDDVLGPFFGLGWGHLLLASLSEAMEHENLLDVGAFWNDVQQSIAVLTGLPYAPPASPPGAEEPAPAASDDAATGSPEESAGAADPAPPPAAPTDWREPLKAAAGKILTAREVLYPVTIHLLNVRFLDASPDSEAFDIPSNFIAATAALERFAADNPDRFARIREAVQNETVELCGGCYLEREDPILPLDSQLWNLRQGLDRARELLGKDIRVYARKRFGYHPHLPLLLTTNGLTKAIFLTFDETSGLPNYSNVVVSWPSPDGKQVDAFVRAPKYADSVETFFNLGNTWFKTTREDHSATIFLMHRDKPTCVWHHDLMELARLAPVLGEWMTFSRYLGQVTAGEYPSVMTADDFHFDYLSERIAAKSVEPVGAFARHQRTRRRIDACWTYAALNRALCGSGDTLDVAALHDVEKEAESTLTLPPQLDDLEKRITAALANRLQSRAEPNKPGVLLLNPCGFARRAALELDAGAHPLPIGGIVKACQLDNDKVRAVIEVPALGFAWLPREGPPGTPIMAHKMRLADPASRLIRNEHFEIEIDAATGGLKAIRDHKTRVNRLGQMLVFNPGSRMTAKEIKVTHAGPALAEIVSEGFLLGEQDQVLAKFRQRFRLWMGRPLLEMRIEITPQQAPSGYGWHAYFGARFAWRDERAALVRGFNGLGYITNHPRPQTPDYLDIRTPPLSTTIFTGGLPFHLKQGTRMVDVILVPEGETTTTFDLGIAFDREVAMQTAWGYTSPLAVVPTTKGPPHIGASGWLFHIDASNLLLMRMTPGLAKEEGGRRKDEKEMGHPSEDAITARFLECANYSGLAEFRCVRDPQRATVLDARGQFMAEANRSGDVVHLEVTPNDLIHVQVEFSLPSEPAPASE